MNNACLTILYVMRDPPGFGGAERRLLEIGKRLAAKGHRIHIISGKTRANLPDTAVIDGIQFHYLTMVPEWGFRFYQAAFYLSRYLFYIRSLFWGKQIQQIQPDIIIDCVTPSPSLVYYLAKWHKIPCLAEIMEYRTYAQWQEVADPVTAVLGAFSQTILFRRLRYAHILTISQATHQQLVENGRFPPDAISVIPPAIDTTHIPPPPNNAQRNRRELIIVGRLMPQKGHKLLFDALKQIHSQHPDVTLKVVGEGPMRSRLEAYAHQIGVAQAVTFTGWVSEAEKLSLMQQATLFVMPSLQEGFGLVLLEAMACGLPIVAFDLPVYQEFLDEQSACLVAKGDVPALAKNICALLQNEGQRNTMSAFNITHVPQFTWDDTVTAVENILRQHAQFPSFKTVPIDHAQQQS